MTPSPPASSHAPPPPPPFRAPSPRAPIARPLPHLLLRRFQKGLFPRQAELLRTLVINPRQMPELCDL